MNNIFNNLTTSLSGEFKKFDLDEAIQLSMSKIAGYDLQINNLVKYNKSNFFDVLQENVIETINSSNIFLPVEKNDMGFLNLSLNHIYLMKNITNTQSDFENDQSSKIIFDYGGPNIGKPLHVGHMRTLNIGRSLYNIHSFIGNQVVSDIHLGDWGMPIAQIITYLEKEEIELQNLDSSQLEIIYPKASEEYKQNKDFKTRAQEINKLLNNNDQELLEIKVQKRGATSAIDSESPSRSQFDERQQDFAPSARQENCSAREENCSAREENSSAMGNNPS